MIVNYNRETIIAQASSVAQLVEHATSDPFFKGYNPVSVGTEWKLRIKR
jgi:hypothetical protein